MRRILYAVFILMIFGQLARADTLPGSGCGTSQYPADTFMSAPNSTDGSINNMFCNGSTWSGVINFQSSGYVGIGTATPDAVLNIKAPTGGPFPFVVTSGTNDDVVVDSYGNFEAGSRQIFIGYDNARSLMVLSSSYSALYITSDGAGGNTNDNIILYPNGTGKVGIENTSPQATLDVNGTAKLGTAGTAMTAMGVCTVASYTPSNATTNVTCTGVPASSSVAVSCSAAAAFSAPNSTVIYARAIATANKIAVNLSAGNTNATTLTCMWVQP